MSLVIVQTMMCLLRLIWVEIVCRVLLNWMQRIRVLLNIIRGAMLRILMQW